jgi:hypothetical protein
MINGKYTTPEKRPRSTPPGLTEKEPAPTALGALLKDHPFAPGGRPDTTRPAETAYGRAELAMYARNGDDPMVVPGPWLALGDLRRELNAAEGSFQYTVNQMVESGRYEVKDNLFRCTAPVYTRTRTTRAGPKAASDSVDEALAALRRKAEAETGIPGLTTEQALGWLRAKLRHFTDLTF